MPAVTAIYSVFYVFLSSHVASVLSPDSQLPAEAVDLQVDYWMISPKAEVTERLDRSAKKEVKCSLKTMFCSMQVFRPQLLTVLSSQQQQLQQHSTSDAAQSGLSMVVVTKDKKQKS